MKILVNDDEIEVADDVTVAGLVAELGFPHQGIAVAVDWAVIPRSEWETVLHQGSRVDVVTAVQGG